jgi:uncharacterized protein DUF2510
VVTDGGGWYPDPEGVPGRERWWDGTGWTERTREPADELAGFGAGRRPGSWFAGRRRLALLGAAGVLVLAVVGALVATHGGPPDRTVATPGPGFSGSSGPTTVPPEGPRVGPAPLVCPSAAPTLPTGPPAAPTGPTTGPTTGPPGATPPARAPRVTDREAGISYAGQGRPWSPWPEEWITPGLGARFGAGYYLVTQRDTPDGLYYATVLSGAVLAQAEARCVAERIADDVRAAYYPTPNLRRIVTARPVSVGDHPGYLIRYHLSFHVPGYDARGEQVGVLVLDVGRPALAVLYISIPDTVRRFDPLIDEVFDSVRVI